MVYIQVRTRAFEIIAAPFDKIAFADITTPLLDKMETKCDCIRQLRRSIVYYLDGQRIPSSIPFE